MLSRSLPARTRLLAALTAVALTTVGCATSSALSGAETGTDAPTGGATETESFTRYVALGDSYTAAPLFPDRTRAPRGCMRSANNYPAMVAAELPDVEAVDVSCSGASTVSMYDEQSFPGAPAVRPPQLDALTPDTDLVTLGIGANDYLFFTQMVVECLDIAPTDPEGQPCRQRNAGPRQQRIDRQVVDIGTRVSEVVLSIRERAPEARVLVVGYPQLLPDDGMCRDRMPLARGDYAFTRELNVRLAEAVRDGGLASGAEYVDLFAASKGHDICAEEPWVAGTEGFPNRAMGLHPFPEEQEAVAELILGML